MHKKIIKWITLVILIFSGLSSNSLLVSAQDEQVYEIGIGIYDQNVYYMQLVRDELIHYFEELSAENGKTYNLDFQDGTNNQSTQRDQILAFIEEDKDLIIANLVEPSRAQSLTLRAQEADIPLIYLNREPEPEAMGMWPGKVTYIGADGREAGILQGEIIAGLDNHGDLNDDGKVNYIMIMGDSRSRATQQRTLYSIRRLEEDISTEILGSPERGDWNERLAQEITVNALIQYGTQLEVIFTNNDAMALGAMSAIEGAGRVVNEDIYIVSVDAIPEVVELLGEGKFTGTVLHDHRNLAITTVEVADLMLAGQAVETYYWHQHSIVTKPEDADFVRQEYLAESVEEYLERTKDIYGNE